MSGLLRFCELPGSLPPHSGGWRDALRRNATVPSPEPPPRGSGGWTAGGPRHTVTGGPGGAMPDQSALLDQVRRYFEYAGADVDRAHEVYHDDAVLEFPQSGGRFEGAANFREWRRQYPADVRFRVPRVTAREG